MTNERAGYLLLKKGVMCGADVRDVKITLRKINRAKIENVFDLRWRLLSIILEYKKEIRNV